ncbi:MAG: VWA domain-containing protein [Candidatus Glassbacteria bacterium]|nr:VWA domain-containing protein [Candidatus Glassbacteria bacterium]
MSREFASADFLYLLFVLVPLVWVYLRWRAGRRRSLSFPDLATASRVNTGSARYRPHLPFALRVLALTLIIVALARPRSGSTLEETSSEGIDIVLTVDISTSMLAQDLKRGSDRLDVVKEVVSDFIGRRQHDRMGLVAFAAQAATRCPPTLDYRVLESQLDGLEIGQIEDGTAIGVALASSVNRLRKSKAKSRVIVLLTDGVNNRGAIDPVTAARVAEAESVKVYTIGAGTRGTAPIPVKDAFGRTRYVNQQVEIDEEVLKQIAGITGGKYFRATAARELEEIYREIDSLEKTRIEVRQYKRYRELFVLLLLPVLGLVLLEQALAETKCRTLP